MAAHRPFYNAALKALEKAHRACFDHPDRGAIGMSSGPFAGVNEALEIVDTLETENTRLRAEVEALSGNAIRKADRSQS